MDGLEFEECVKELLELVGFRNVEMTPRFDKGADLIATRDGERTAVQDKSGEEPDLDTSHCAECGANVTAVVTKFCLDQPGRFGGLVDCMQHQARSRRTH
jgi:hypothetical protein